MMTDDERNLRALVTAGWANESDGHVDSPMGHFAIIDLVNDRHEMADVLEIDEDELPAAHYYLVVEDSNGNVDVSTYYMFSSAEDEFRDLQQHYVLWADDGEDE